MSTRIVIAEDESIIALNLQMRLRTAGYTVIDLVVSGEAAIEAATAARPDLVLMDIKLQGQVDGIEAAQAIRARLDIPVVYLTAYADEATLQRAKISEPFGYVLKPFEMQELQSTIEMALYKHAMDRRLRDSERRYRQLVETLQEGVWAVDRDACTTYVNPRMAEMLGYAPEEMLGRHLFTFMDDRGVALATRQLERRARGTREQHEFEFRHKSGSRVYTLLETSPILDEEGAYAGAIAGVMDVSDRVKAQEQLRLRTSALEAAANAVAVSDSAGCIVWVNPAFTRLTGYLPEEALGQTARLVESGAQDATFYQHMAQTLVGGQAWRGELLNRRRDGTLYTAEMTVTPVMDVDGSPAHYIAIMQDITERKQADEELHRAKDAAEAANRAKSTFIANVGHELRTPLNAIIGYSEILQEECRDRGQPDMIADLERIRAAGHNLLALVSDILDLSRVEAGRAELRPERFDVGQLLDEVARTLAPLAQKQGNALSVCVDDGTGAVVADRAKVRQILLNLGSNACKFTEAGQILLAARRVPPGGDWLEIRVSDTGIGIAADRHSELFSPFNPIDASTTRRHGGTGLGLALSGRLCHLMGGTITVDSEPGRGSTFTVRLPGDIGD